MTYRIFTVELKPGINFTVGFLSAYADSFQIAFPKAKEEIDYEGFVTIAHSPIALTQEGIDALKEQS